MKDTDVPQPGPIFFPRPSPLQIVLVPRLLRLRRRTELQMPL
jgi:hypothetical protein